MRYGVCISEKDLEQAVNAGVDYVECAVTGLNALTDEQLNRFAERLAQNNIKCEALNVLFPGEIRLTGADMDINRVKEYIARTLQRIKILSPDIIVFGSGGARACPQAFSREKAHEQLVSVGRVLAEEAAQYGITIALEPLNRKETNLINSLAEARGLVAAVDHPHFKLTADFYHMLMEGETAQDLAACGDTVAHAHIATNTTRVCPAASDKYMFEDYFQALKDVGYDKRLSIEGRIDDYQRQLPAAFEMFRMCL